MPGQFRVVVLEVGIIHREFALTGEALHYCLARVRQEGTRAESVYGVR